MTPGRIREIPNYEHSHLVSVYCDAVRAVKDFRDGRLKKFISDASEFSVLILVNIEETANIYTGIPEINLNKNIYKSKNALFSSS